MRKTESTTIDGLAVECTQLGFEAADKLWFELLAVATPALGKLEGMDVGMDISKLGPALGAFINSMPEQKAVELKRKLLEGTTVFSEETGRKMPVHDRNNAEVVFTGRLPAYYKVLWFALKTNFEDFFKGDTALFAGLMDQGPESQSTTPTNANTTTEHGSSIGEG